MKLNYNKNIDIELFDTLKEISVKTSKLLKKGNIALSGGSTYLKLLKSWDEMDLNLNGVEFYPVDERVVDFDSEFSNWGNSWRVFLKNSNKNRDHHFPNATEYNDILKEIDMDTIFLGVGDDGHTASLFSSSYVFENNNLKARSSISPKEPQNRVSLTGNYIASARNIVIIFLGDGKESIVNMVLSGEDLPITTLLKRVNKGTIYIHRPLLGENNG